ncbi:unnamed protein product, partial [Prorocentrum cordatum]
AAAALRDVLALLELLPPRPAHMLSGAESALQELWAFADEVAYILKHVLTAPLRVLAPQSPVAGSPYAGPPPVAEAAPVDGAPFDAPARATLRTATLNPGRCGFLQLGADQLLEWRLEAVAFALDARSVDICILPGARFPEGAALPEGFPYCWGGARSAAWNSVGVFFRPEVEHMLRPLPDLSSNREQWFEVWGDGPRQGPAVVFCAFYPRHGGDTDTWRSVVAHATLCQDRYPHARVLLGGDGNANLDYLVDHPELCTCAHCKQSSADKETQQWLEAAGPLAFNPPTPTHVSGTCIDLFVSVRASPLPVHVQPDLIALSDHRPVIAEVPCQFAAPWAAGLGRVAWTSGPQWDEGLREISSTLEALSRCVEEVSSASWLRPQRFGGSATRLQRRAVVNVAAWARDAVYTLVGHAAGATKVMGGKRQATARKLLGPASFASHHEFKMEIARAAWGERRRAVHRFLHLRTVNPGAAERFLSGFYQMRKRFDVRLADPTTGATMPPPEMVEAVQRDLFARDRNDVEQDPEAAEAMERQVARIRKASALEGAPAPPPPYSDTEVIAVLEAPAGIRLTKALMNLARAACVTATIWSLRQITPLRKSGPATVRAVSGLRPISIATDMASVQDALWITRNSGLLEAFRGPCQQGGVGDALTLVVGSVVQAQLRHAQGLHTWWALADGKWAFDVASRPVMLLGVFQAGVRGPDWLVLDDVMAQDHQCLCLHGLLSPVFMLLRGTAQGRRFSAHVFNTQLRGPADDIADVLPQGCSTIVPPFARAALLDVVEDAPPVHCATPPRGELQLDGVVREASRLAAADLTPWPQARHFLSGALSELSSLAGRID